MSKSKKIQWPPPGTTEAQALGCVCPIEDNKHGVGVPLGLGVAYWCDTTCPLHGKLAKEKANG